MIGTWQWLSSLQNYINIYELVLSPEITVEMLRIHADWETQKRINLCF